MGQIADRTESRGCVTIANGYLASSLIATTLRWTASTVEAILNYENLSDGLGCRGLASELPYNR